MSRVSFSSYLLFQINLACVLVLSVVNSCMADFVLTVQNATLVAGELGKVDVYIHSTGSDAVQFANYTFRIDPISGGAPGVLEFRRAQSSSEQQSTNPPYFLGSDIDSGNFSAVVQQDNTTQITGFDYTASGNDVIVGSADRLLASLELQHTGSGLTGEFKISLVQNPLLTFFQNANGDPIAITNESFTTNFGRISVGPATAVPEPACLWACALLLFVRRTSSPSQSSRALSGQRVDGLGRY